MTVDQNQPQGIQQFDTTDSGSDLIIDAPSTPDLRPVKLILLAMILGITVGLLFGTRAVVFGPIGSTIIGMIKTLAGPLILFAVLEAFLKTEAGLADDLCRRHQWGVCRRHRPDSGERDSAWGGLEAVSRFEISGIDDNQTGQSQD